MLIKFIYSAESNGKSIFLFLVFELWPIVFTILRWYIRLFKCVTEQKKRSFKSGQIYRKGAECAETNEKWFFSFLIYRRFVLKIHPTLADFECKIDHISKTKSRKNWFFIRFSTFHIFHVNMNTLFSWSVFNRIQINTKKKYFIIVHISTRSLWNIGLFRWTHSWYILAGIEERLHTKLFLNSSQSLFF